ncbi:MAG: hypothetical protein ILP24_07825 [Paludibacteraceae bacterium]|nr:hypothetical protein [Paludibacteraceae bacterium]
MNKYTGVWKFNSMTTFDDDGKQVRMDAEAYINSPLDEESPEEIKHELDERKRYTQMLLEVHDDHIAMKMPLPEGVSQAEIDEAVASGEIRLADGMMLLEEKACEVRNGDLYINSNIQGETLGEPVDPWVKLNTDDGFLELFTTRFERVK